MPLKLIVKQYGGPEIAAVMQSADGRLQVQALVAPLQAEVEALVRQVSQNPLPLTGGDTKEEGQEIVNTTTRRMVTPGDPDYLRALADALGEPGCKLQGKRVRAYVVEG